MRKPAGYLINSPGDLVQVDTVQIKFRNSEIRYQFSARDAISRWDYQSGLSSERRALRRRPSWNTWKRSSPFPSGRSKSTEDRSSKKTSRTPVGSRGSAVRYSPAITQACKATSRRSNRTHREEFYEVEDIELSLEGHNRQLEEWNKTYNYIRPHQSLGYQTPHEFYQNWLKEHNQPKSH